MLQVTDRLADGGIRDWGKVLQLRVFFRGVLRKQKKKVPQIEKWASSVGRRSESFYCDVWFVIFLFQENEARNKFQGNVTKRV